MTGNETLERTVIPQELLELAEERRKEKERQNILNTLKTDERTKGFINELLSQGLEEEFRANPNYLNSFDSALMAAQLFKQKKELERQKQELEQKNKQNNAEERKDTVPSEPVIKNSDSVNYEKKINPYNFSSKDLPEEVRAKLPKSMLREIDALYGRI